MAKGCPKNGFRMTKKRLAAGWTPGKNVTKNVSVPVVLKQEFAPPIKKETDEEIRAKLKDAFMTMDKITEATCNGVSKSFILSGPPGLGKSYGVMKIAEKFEKMGNKVCVVKGFVRATGLYKVLYEYRERNSVVIFDDSDSVFWDMDALNLLKSACDMTRVRNLSWLAETNMKDESEEKLPTKFEFEGSIVFLTNMDFDALIAKGNKLAVHFEAMISRSIYLKLPINTRRDYMMRIAMVVEEGMLNDMGLSKFDSAELLMFIDKNCEKLRELSLRMVIKIANLMKIDRNDWQKLARSTCFLN
jgi:uncharacterized protein YkuJ